LRSDVTPTEDRGFRLGEVNDSGISLIEADKEEDSHQLFSNRICAPKLTELKIEEEWRHNLAPGPSALKKTLPTEKQQNRKVSFGV
jgi:hypothetical protein